VVKTRDKFSAGSSKESARKPMTSWRQSTAGLRRALIPPTFKRPRRCPMSWGDKTGVPNTLLIHFAQCRHASHHPRHSTSVLPAAFSVSLMLT
jgi:hypothetical protein